MIKEASDAINAAIALHEDPTANIKAQPGITFVPECAVKKGCVHVRALPHPCNAAEELTGSKHLG